MLKKVVKLLSSVKAKVVGEEKLGETDASVLKVAMMISALDGDVSGDELEAFGKLARQCRGYSTEASARVFDEGLRCAGYIVLQSKRLSEKKLLDLFVAEASEAMPNGFAVSSGEDVRRAFVMWLTMALADGDFSQVERKAIDAFRKHLDKITESINAYDESCRSAYSPAFAHAFVLADLKFKFKSATTDAFMKKAEKLISGLGCEASADVVAKELRELIVKG